MSPKGRVPVATHGWIEHVPNAQSVLHPIARHGHVHVSQVESSWCSRCLHVIAHGEVTIAVGVATRGSDVGRVNDIAVDELKLFPLVACVKLSPCIYLRLSAISQAILDGASRRACARSFGP